MNTPPPTSTSTAPIDLTASVRRAAVALVLMGAAGIPATYFLAGRFLETPQVLPATAAGAWVWVVALLGLVPLWLARTAPPAQQVNARLGHVMLRLLLTAGGLVGLLLLMPENDRMRIGLAGLIWYGLTWVIDFSLLRQSAAQTTS